MCSIFGIQSKSIASSLLKECFERTISRGPDMSQEAMNLAIKKAIDAIIDIEGVERISAGNFEGQLGEHKTNLLDILKE